MSTTINNRKPVRSASAIIAGTESGQHLLKIDGYSHTKDKLPNGSDIKSRSFRVGGHYWLICYYPNGSHLENTDSISIYLKLKHDITEGVKAHFTFTILDRAGRPAHTGDRLKYVFRDHGWAPVLHQEGYIGEIIEYLWEDCLTIMCDLTVFKELETQDIDVTAATPPPPPLPLPLPTVVVPPSDLCQHVGALLATGEGADVRFEVDGKIFAAHRWVLAARSPVFRAELFGPEKKARATDVVRINDMEAYDFVVLLCYMYTDCLPEWEGEVVAMLPDLIAAANRYKMERLRLICEHKLCEYVNERTVIAMLAFAEEHHCNGLKEKCLRLLDDPVKLRGIVKTEGLEHMSKNYPYIMKDVTAKLAAAPA